MSYNFYLPHQIETAFEYFLKSGHEAWLVGGCVRDFIMGKIPHDYDMTTNALPDETKEIFKDFKVIETGIKHGTVTVVIDSCHIEITTYRFDGKYSDNRHPQNVTFTQNISDDLMRRDFTMNAIAYNPHKGIFDPFGGENHIRQNKIVCVGDADKRFLEDGLRILRALRFSSQLSFEIENQTAKSIIKNKALLNNISKERIFTEFSKLICAKSASRVLKEYAEVFEEFLEGCGDFSASADIIRYIPDNIYLKLSALSYSCDIGSTLTILKASNDIKSTVKKIVSYRNFIVIPEKNFLKRFLMNCDLKTAYLIMEFKKAVLNAQKRDSSHIDSAVSMMDEIIKNDECFCLKQLKINGEDIMKLGFLGVEIKQILEDILLKVVDGVVINDNSSISDYINENYVAKTVKK